jgi:hypothetical protein
MNKIILIIIMIVINIIPNFPHYVITNSFIFSDDHYFLSQSVTYFIVINLLCLSLFTLYQSIRL